MRRAAAIVFSALGSALALAGDAHVGPVTDLVVADGEIYSCSQAGIFVGKKDNLRRLVSPAFRVTRLAWLYQGGSSGARLMFSGGQPGETGSVGLISMGAEHQSTELLFDSANDFGYDIAVSPDGKLSGVACADGTVQLARFADEQPPVWAVRHRHTSTARAVAFSPNGKWFASAGLDGVIMISPADADADDDPRQLLDHTAGVDCLVWSPDSKKIASGSRDSKVRLHEVSGKLIRTYTGLGMEAEPVAGRVSARVLSLAWNEHHLVAGTSKGTLHRLSQADDTMHKLSRPDADPIHSLAFGPGGVLFIGGLAKLHELRIEP